MEIVPDTFIFIYYQKANDFTDSTLKDLIDSREIGSSFVQETLDTFGVPFESVFSEMTMNEIGELAVYAKRLKTAAKSLKPTAELSIINIPKDALPSYALERKLVSVQRKEERISGSDMGDSHIVPLIFYADFIEVDKRTKEFLNQIIRREPEISSLAGKFFSSSNYSQIPELL
jgi:hypothetical protein